MRYLGYDSLDTAIARADFVVLAAPQNSAHQQTVDGRRLQLFKPNAYLVNVARGSLVDEAALVTGVADAPVSRGGS